MLLCRIFSDIPCVTPENFANHFHKHHNIASFEAIKQSQLLLCEKYTDPRAGGHGRFSLARSETE